MKTHAVIGAQWGDEGKGKITDVRAQKADVIVRFQGGDNAGHTIKFSGQTHTLHLIPSGIFSQGTLNVLANGMVINPFSLHHELEVLKENGIDTSMIAISNRAHVILPFHQIIDSLQDHKRSDKIGTTAKGIGPAYGDKILRRGLRMGEFISERATSQYLLQTLPRVNAAMEEAGKAPFDKATLEAEIARVRTFIAPLVRDTSKLLFDYYKQNKRMLFEGAQGTMLCIDHGTYPYVTSSSPTAAAIPLGCGLPPQVVGSVEGVVKAYTTRVGGGTFPSEIEGSIATRIRQKGNEYGSTTGRPRRVGWLDTVALSHALRVNGFTTLTLTLLDVLEDFDTIKVCTSYNLDGTLIDYVPASIEAFNRCEPVYETLAGFKGPIGHVRDYHDLPSEAKVYIAFIEATLGVPIGTVSVGPDREQTFDIIRVSDFHD